MKLYYVTDEETAKSIIRYTSNFHYLTLVNGQVIVAIKFSEEAHELEFSRQPNVVACPHPLSGQTFGQASVSNPVMSVLKQHGITPSDTMHSAAEKLGVINPHMRLTVF